jgi:hypothetical protein
MKLKSIITICTFSYALVSTPAAETWWRIVNGPGAGVVVRGTDYTINDTAYLANGFIAYGHYPDCECTFADGHYHGILFDDPDPDASHCGWGCVLQMPASSGQADSWLRGEIDGIGTIAPDLADKLDDILTSMEGAASIGCYSAVEALADAFDDEIYAYFGAYGDSPDFDPVFRYLADYVNLTEFGMESSLGYAHLPVLKANTINILRRVGSGSLSTLLDAGPKITARVGRVLSFEGYGEGITGLKWTYKWKGAEEGELPSGCSLSYYDNHVTLLSQKTAQVRLTLWGMLPSNKMVKDSILVNFVPKGF